MLSKQSKTTHNADTTRDIEGLQPVNSDVINETELTVCQQLNAVTSISSGHNVGYDKHTTPQNDNELTVKFHTDLLSNIIQTRQLNNTYQTNKLIKNVGAYYILKAICPSGIIQNYHNQIHELCKYLNCTQPTFYKLIKACEQLGYLKRTRQTLVLSSFTVFADTFDSIATQFTKVNYNFKEQKISHVLECAYLQIREQVRGKVFENKLKALPEVVNELSNLINPDKNGKYQKSLEALQIQAFKHGHSKMNLIFSFNPFTTCNSKTMCEMFGFKSEQSVAYLKAKLVSKKLVSIIKTRVPSQKNQRIKKRFVEWDAKTKQTIWVLPDTLEYAPILRF